jgi:transposase
MVRHKKPRKKYTEEYKKDAVRLMLARGSRTVGEIATELGIHESLLHRWYRRYGVELSGQPENSQNDRENMERMRRRLRELEQENALLKKAAALFAKEMK